LIAPARATPRGNTPLRLVLVGSMGSVGDNLYRLHQPASALAALPGVEVFEVHPQARHHDSAVLAADVVVFTMALDVEVFRLIHQRRQLGRTSLCEVNDYLPDVQAWNPAHASWSDRRALFCFDQLIRRCDATQVTTEAIGQRLARLLSGFGCTLLYSKRTPLTADEEAALGARHVALDALLSTSDVVTLHCPLTPQTAGLIDAAALARMKRTAVLVNVARGGVVVEHDLVAALRAGTLHAAAMDVFDIEPLPADSPLIGLDNLVLTPHLAAVTADTFAPTVLQMFANIQRAARSGGSALGSARRAGRSPSARAGAGPAAHGATACDLRRVGLRCDAGHRAL
jgi:lactate dehydrogenase-like 2-hydroxyacid dehydrogenase